MVEIRKVVIEDLEDFNALLNSICKERSYLAYLDGVPLEKHRRLLENVVSKELPQMMAVVKGKIVGWCDVLPNPIEGFTHTGRLGMGGARDFRSKGLGNKLLTACIKEAGQYGLKKIELEVFSDNAAAYKLYKKHGFCVEGLKEKSRKVDGVYQDIQLMGLWMIGNDA